ncbi:AAA family ATPase [Desulfosarcina sp.]|uniref:AAA family ATPase n=1 Tax=Desulfosarcina sp. TaxID=2027861 RepID=UPI0035691545
MFKLVFTDPVDTPPDRVYLAHYQLSEAPFAITPDPEFLFSASCHQQVLDKISYAIDGRMGFVLLTGEVGTGKTTLCRALLDRLSLDAETVYVINPSLSGHELLASILEDLGTPPPPQTTKKALIDQLNQHLLTDSTNRPFVVIIDDAQTMTPETLEDLRLLSNLESDKRKLIQVVLSGQPELLEMLANERLRQLKQRIAVHCRLHPLTVQETAAYISRRLSVAGNTGQVSFSHAATQLIHKRSGGIPRLINKICDFTLTAGYVSDAPVLDPAHVNRALAELPDPDIRGHRNGGPILRCGLPAAAMLVLVLFAAVVWALRPGDQAAATPVQPRPAVIQETAEPAAGVQQPNSDGVCLAPSTTELTAGKVAACEISADTSRTTGGACPPGPVDKERVTPPTPSPAAYALQLGSFRTVARARRSVAQYRQKAIAAHWQAVEGGQWYRILAGKFENRDQAVRYRNEHQLTEARIIHAPWTVRVLPGRPDLSESEIIRFISEIGYDSLMETGPAGDNEIYTGLFVSVEDAAVTANRINSSDQILAQVVTR